MNIKKISVAFIVLFLLSGIESYSQTSKYKVAFLYNFTNYVEWPENSMNAEFIIAVLGSDASLIDELNNLAKMKNIRGKKIKIKVFKNIQEISQCHILYITKSFAGKIGTINSVVSEYNVLLVSDYPGTIQKGIAINFVVNNDKLGFDIEPGNATKYGLKVNSRLKALASNNK